MGDTGNTTSLRRRILRAGVWTLGGHVAGQFLRLASNLIMTRLLVPEMFGIMVLANVIMVGLALFSDIGLNQGIIQCKRGGDPAYLNTAWSVQILRGALIWATALGIGGGLYLLGKGEWLPLGSVYADPILPFVIVALSFNALISGFTSTRIATANRNLAMGRVTLVELISQLAGMVCMIGWALIDRSIWALVLGALFAGVLRVFLSHTIVPGEKNRLHWDRDAFAEIFGFGKWIFLTSIIGFLAANGDRVILGWLVDPATLGLYAIAFFLVSALQEAFSKFIGNVAFPALSEVVRERRASLKSVYYKFRLPMDIATLVSAGLLFSAGHLLIQVLYDSRYQDAGHMIEILAISLFGIRFSLAGQCFLAMGLPKLLIPIYIAWFSALFLLMPLAYEIWNLEGALWIAGGSMLFSLPVTVYQKIRYGLFDLKHELIVLPLLGVGYLLGVGLNHMALAIS